MNSSILLQTGRQEDYSIGGLLPSEPQIIDSSRQYGVVTNLGISEVIKDGKTHDNIFEELEKLEEWIRSVAEILNRHLYQSLENQYEFLTNDTAIKESILTNEYLFTADGRAANYLVELNKRTPKIRHHDNELFQRLQKMWDKEVLTPRLPA